MKSENDTEKLQGEGGLESSLVLSRNAIVRARALFAIVEPRNQKEMVDLQEEKDSRKSAQDLASKISIAAATASAGPSKGAAERWSASAASGLIFGRGREEESDGTAADQRLSRASRQPALSLGNADLYSISTPTISDCDEVDVEITSEGSARGVTLVL